MRIGCTIGNGTAQSATPGTPAYVDDGYVDPGWQPRTGETFMPIAGEVAYGDPSGVPIVDDGIDCFGLAPADLIQALDVINGETAQTAVLDQRFEDIPRLFCDPAGLVDEDQSLGIELGLLLEPGLARLADVGALLASGG